MVRVNLVNPKQLADQQLVAEHNEILILIAYIKKYPACEDLPKEYCLGPGHMRFFKDKIAFLHNRHESLKKEMKLRGFKTTKKVSLKGFKKQNLKDWKPTEKDLKIIKKRLTEKLKKKPEFYRYNGKKGELKFFLNLLNL